MRRTKQTHTPIEKAQEATPLQPKIRRRRLKTLADLSRFMSSLINDTRQGKIDPGLASKLGYLINILKSVISESDLEARILAMEKEIQNRR